LFIFLVIPGDEEIEGLRFLYDLACGSDGRVIVLPFIFREGYLVALEGAAFGIFPSLYEPFGGANEYYLLGTVGIARATGGLVQQIVPVRDARCYSHAVHSAVIGWHDFSANPTGFLYRESYDDGTLVSWQVINDGEYVIAGINGPDRVTQRQDLAVFKGMVRELRCAIADAERIYREKPALYTQLALDGMSYIERTFSWYRASQEYIRAVP
jgi:glycogen synthase